MIAAALSQYRTPPLFSPKKHRASKSRRNVKAVAQAVMKVVAQELGEKACKCWPELIDEELGEALFVEMRVKKDCRAVAPSRECSASAAAWTPNKPKLTRLMLAALVGCGSNLIPADAEEEEPPLVVEAPMSLRTDQHCKCVRLSKLLARRAVESIQRHRRDALKASGELSDEQLQCPVRSGRALARVASDTLAYLSAVAVEGRSLCDGESDEDVVVELHGTDQRLVGISTRGCGIVFNARGRALFEAAVETMRARLEAPPDDRVGLNEQSV